MLCVRSMRQSDNRMLGWDIHGAFFVAVVSTCQGTTQSLQLFHPISLVQYFSFCQTLSDQIIYVHSAPCCCSEVSRWNAGLPHSFLNPLILQPPAALTGSNTMWLHMHQAYALASIRSPFGGLREGSPAANSAPPAGLS